MLGSQKALLCLTFIKFYTVWLTVIKFYSYWLSKALQGLPVIKFYCFTAFCKYSSVELDYKKYLQCLTVLNFKAPHSILYRTLYSVQYLNLINPQEYLKAFPSTLSTKTKKFLFVYAVYCGICHGDVLWAEGFIKHGPWATKWPIVPGHELAGIVTKVCS